jgi:competence protein ComEC
MLPALLFVLSVGIIAISLMPVLPHWLFIFTPLFLLLLNFRFSSRALLLLIALSIGMSWGIGYGHYLLDNVLDEKWVGQELLLQGKIVDLPVIDEQQQGFVIAVSHLESVDGVLPAVAMPKKIRLSWFNYTGEVQSGEHWQFLVKLKKPGGFVNPGGFDYQGWLMRRDVGATGSIGQHNRINKKLEDAAFYDVDHWRFQIRQWMLATTDSPWRGIALALVIGDRSLISAEHWQLLQRTGTNHLIAISGMHVSFVAVLAFFIGMTLGRFRLLFNERASPLWLACGCSVAAAVLYSLLAGLSLPTQRAMIMVLVAQLVVLCQRSFRSRDALLVAWVLVLLVDPLAAYDPGLWLSFGAVATLLASFSGYAFLKEKHYPGKSLLRAQTVIFAGLFVPLVLLIHSVSLVAPVANLLAIPLVTLWVVPCLLLALPLHILSPVLAEMLVSLGLYGIQLLLQWDALLLTLADDKVNPVIALNGLQVLLALLACALCLLPKGLLGRWLAAPLLLLVIGLPYERRPPLQLTFLDVGQGLAVVIKTPSQTLLYDTGPRFSEKFDAGSAIIVPYLHRTGIRVLDTLIVSHNDNDHAGGVEGVLSGLQINRALWGDMTAIPETLRDTSGNCHEEPSWQADGVEFSFVSIPAHLTNTSNNHSCIFQIAYGEHRFLLPGDAEQAIERWLVSQPDLNKPVTLLAAGHHGSRTSSTDTFVRALAPEVVVFSAGYQSRFGHPHAEVVRRFEAQGSRLFNTAYSGAVMVRSTGGGELSITGQRQVSRRYWHDRREH